MKIDIKLQIVTKLSSLQYIFLSLAPAANETCVGSHELTFYRPHSVGVHSSGGLLYARRASALPGLYLSNGR